MPERRTPHGAGNHELTIWGNNDARYWRRTGSDQSNAVSFVQVPYSNRAFVTTGSGKPSIGSQVDTTRVMVSVPEGAKSPTGSGIPNLNIAIGARAGGHSDTSVWSGGDAADLTATSFELMEQGRWKLEIRRKAVLEPRKIGTTLQDRVTAADERSVNCTVVRLLQKKPGKTAMHTEGDHFIVEKSSEALEHVLARGIGEDTSLIGFNGTVRASIDGRKSRRRRACTQMVGDDFVCVLKGTLVEVDIIEVSGIELTNQEIRILTEQDRDPTVEHPLLDVAQIAKS